MLPDLWAVHFYSYLGELSVEGVTVPIRPGSVSAIPPGARMRFRYHGPSEHFYAHLRLPDAAGSRERLRLMDDLARDGGAVRGCFRRLAEASPDAPGRVRAAVWELLWQLADRARAGDSGGGPPGADPVVLAAVRRIEQGLAGPLRVAALADALGVSHNHLTRRFQAELGCTVVEHVRRRRMARAEHMLLNSTLAVKSIAIQVGIPDLQAFNKACRRHFGTGPRGIRGGDRPPL
ncbi:helix-turn-helix transcriptional regulator [Mangrovactinospora gilvigrisea]|uniref:helix-turn-helix transcriptional regulator n=1 Tax=Mangrovactinospora gilvigrisea TaxID=1428644 RepID=UPI001FE5CEFE|nr:AraC family transcriptional regulator [Mangrovactinospora gilvigrisea]